MTELTRLHAKQSADVRTCGSCEFFDRERNDPNAPTKGQCTVRLPPWIKLQHTHAYTGSKANGFPAGIEYVEDSSQWRRVEDTETCDLWRPSGLTYVKDQKWSVTSVEQPSEEKSQ